MAAYNHAIVTFIDLLGFARFVDAGARPDTILKVLNAVEEAAHVDDDTREIVGIDYLCISDCMIRCARLESSRLIAPDLQMELLSLCHLQHELLRQGFPIRGGITHGPVYMDGTKVFGPAYQRAYCLESRHANVPRVIVDETLLKDFYGYPEGGGDITHGNALDEVMSLLRRDPTDALLFIDYLAALETEFEEDSDYHRFLIDHRNLIVGKMEEHRDDPRVLAKYEWLRRYHNDVVSDRPDVWLKALRVDRESLTVPAIDRKAES